MTLRCGNLLPTRNEKREISTDPLQSFASYLTNVHSNPLNFVFVTNSYKP